MEEIPPLKDDIEPLLALIRSPWTLPFALEAIRTYRVRMQELLAAAKRAEVERTEREVRLNRFAGFSEEASRKIAFSDLAFFRSELAKELREAVVQERGRLKATLVYLAENEEF